MTFYMPRITLKYLGIVYLDFQKVFDKVPHNKLMFKVKQLGLNGKVYN